MHSQFKCLRKKPVLLTLMMSLNVLGSLEKGFLQKKTVRIITLCGLLKYFATYEFHKCCFLSDDADLHDHVVGSEK